RVRLQHFARQNESGDGRLRPERMSWPMLLSFAAMAMRVPPPGMRTMFVPPMTVPSVAVPPMAVTTTGTDTITTFPRLFYMPWPRFCGDIWLNLRLHLLHLQTQRALQLEYFPALVASNQRRRHAFLARAACPPDAMNKILRNLRQVIIDDVHDVLYVNPARSYVRRHKNLIAPLLEPRQRCISL